LSIAASTLSISGSISGPGAANQKTNATDSSTPSVDRSHNSSSAGPNIASTYRPVRLFAENSCQPFGGSAFALGARRPRSLLLTTLLVPLATFRIFTRLLGIYLPNGLLEAVI
jgi:hypothetical protein